MTRISHYFGRHDKCEASDCAVAYEDEFGMSMHPKAKKFDPGDWDRGGRCICGDPLPPQREWARAGMDWSNILCSNCGRGYVDEEEFFAIYDPHDPEFAAFQMDDDEWNVRSVKGVAVRWAADRTSAQAWAEALGDPDA